MKVYIGYDQREDEMYRVAKASLEFYSTISLDIEPLNRFHPIMYGRSVEHKGDQLWCPISNAPMSTDFAIARFAIPFLHAGKWALFVDCDVLFHADVAELFALGDDRYAVQVVKHKYDPAESVKMDGQAQTSYPCKNWSSVILWNLEHPAHKRLFRSALMSWPGRDLHAFKWLKEEEIGELPLEWNFLVGVNNLADLQGPVKLMHFTLGGPMYERYDDTVCDNAWLEARDGKFSEVPASRRALG